MARRSFVFLLLMVLLPLALLLYLSAVGFPGMVTSEVVKAADARGLCLELGTMRLDVREGIVFGSVKLFQKGVIGPPLFEAAEVGIGLSLMKQPGIARLSSVRIRGGRLRRDANAGALSHGGEGRAEPPESWRIRVVLEHCDVQCLPLSEFICDLRIDGKMARLDNMRGVVGSRHGAGPFSGEIAIDVEKGTFIGHAVSLFDPNELVPFLTVKRLDGLVNQISSFAFPGAPPHIQGDFSGHTGSDSKVLVDGTIKGKGFLRNGVDIASAEARLIVDMGPDGQTVVLSPLRVRRPEGSAKVDLTVDIARSTVQFVGSSTLDPRAVAQIVSPSGPPLLNDFTFGGAVTCVVKGSVNYTNANICSVNARAVAASLGVSHLATDVCSFDFFRNGRTNTASNIKAVIFGGTVDGSACFAPDPASSNTHFRISGNIVNVEFRRIVESLAGDMKTRDSLAGRMSGQIDIEGLSGKGMEKELRGSGKFKVREGNILDLPLFGGLSDMLVRVVPGLRYILRQTGAEGSFVISEGRVSTRDLRIEGEVLSLKAYGSYSLVTEELDFDIELRFMKKKTWVGDVVQTIMLPVTRLFRIKLRGTIANPKWKSVNF